MSDGSVTIDTELNNKGFKSGIEKLEDIGKKGMSTLVTSVGTVATAVGALGTYAVKVGSSFEEGMSKVQAISGATGSELQQLKEKAIEMGSKTKFSATESAEAFQYMAMAGWKTGDMLNGIEGIMNLSAASGENLASVSDIVTDALTAFGLQAKDSAHFADVLAKASSNSNTNVGMMGATFKYVAPIAGSMKYSIEDTAVAIGLMANAGIKGEQAGTALRAILTRLVKPPKEASKALEQLNISVTKSDGTMKPLSKVLDDLRKNFNKLNDSQKAEYASSIAGQEAMSGLLAIVNASDDDYKKLTKAINNANGAAKEQANTMQKNLKGAMIECKSVVETLALKVYEKFKGPMTDGINSVKKAFSDLTNQVSNGNLSNSLDKVATGFGNLVSKAGNLVVTVLPKLIDGLAWVLDHGETIAKAIGVITSAVLYFKTTATISNVVQGWQKAISVLASFEKGTSGLSIAQGVLNGKFTVGQTAVGVLTGKISLATVAQKLWNMAISTNPMVAFTVALTALTAVVVAHCLAIEKENASLGGLRDEVNNQQQSWKELKKAREESLSNSFSEISNTEKLVEELRKITDENGKVKNGYETRAKVILNSLNKALGTEYELNGNIIKQYQDLKTNVDRLIASKKAEALLNAYQAEYETALKEQTKATNNLIELKKKLNETTKKMATGNREEHASASLLYSSIAKEIGEQTNLISSYGKTIEDYQNLQKASIDGTAQAIDEAVKNIGISYEESKQQLSENVEQQIITQGEYVKFLKESLNEAKKSEEIYLESVLQTQLDTEKEKINNLANSLVEQTATVDKLTPDLLKAWKILGDQSYEEYSSSISKLHIETQKEIQKSTGIIACDFSLPDASSNKAEETTLSFEKGLKLVDVTNNELILATGKISSNDSLRDETQKKSYSMTEEYDKKLELSKITEKKLKETTNIIKSDESVENEFSKLTKRAEDKVKSSDSSTWGEHLIKNLAQGIKSATNSSWFTNVLKGVGSKIASYLQHTTPDKGPLKDDDKWTPHMMDNLSNGIKKYAPEVYSETEKLASKIAEGLDVDNMYEKMKTAVDFETAKISTNLTSEAILKASKDDARTVTNDNGININNTQNFYEREATPYEQQKQAKEQLRRLAYEI